LLILGQCGALAACSFAPRYSTPPPPSPPPAQFQEQWKTSAPADADSRGEWWKVFQDPMLDALQARVTTANQNIKAAFARLQQARAETRVQRSFLFPTLTAGPNVTRGRTSLNSPT
jgi:multidrug efflux system outer membrane protein